MTGKRGQLSRQGRRGNVFAVRIQPQHRLELEELCARDGGPKALGPWLVWRALQSRAGSTATSTELPRSKRSKRAGAVVPARASDAGSADPGTVIPELAPSSGTTGAGVDAENPPVGERLILDLCAGSGSWSEPYRAAGYRVQRVTLPHDDVRTFIAPRGVWGVLCAPPCTEFSLAKNGHPRDFVEGLACVNACLRIVWTARPRWWVLENPVGLLARWLGEPADVFEPHHFGDPWSKRTALWGEFRAPERGPYVQALDGGGPLCVVCHPDHPRCCSLAEHRAVTPPGFARAFFEANP